jgi:hypothetical protein
LNSRHGGFSRRPLPRARAWRSSSDDSLYWFACVKSSPVC